MSTHKHDGKLVDGAAFFVVHGRTNIDNYKNKYGKFPPAMFTNQQHLAGWAQDKKFNIEAVGDIPKDEALHIWDETNNRYDAIWVAVKSLRYREAMVWHAESFDLCDEIIETLDADHVINSANVEGAHKDAWLMLLPVGKSSNRSFGSAIEKKLLELDADCISVTLGPIQLLKVFLVAPPKDSSELEKKLREVEGQLEDGPDKENLLRVAKEEYEKIRGWQQSLALLL
jgi:hypothetical protein